MRTNLQLNMKDYPMKKLIVSIALLSAPVFTSANNFNMPNFNNNGSSWSMPTMNWGNGNNGYNNGSNWSMPNMNMGNGTNGSNWNMPTMNWGNNNNGYNNGSNWNMPAMNWGNNGNNGFNNGSNWSMPNMNWGNGNNTGNYNNAPNVQYRAPAMPVAPQFIPRLNTQNKVQAPVQKPITKKAVTATTPAAPKVKITAPTEATIPMPSEVKGTILAPANKPSVEVQKK